jgi:hypothetical protein
MANIVSDTLNYNDLLPGGRRSGVLPPFGSGAVPTHPPNFPQPAPPMPFPNAPAGPPPAKMPAPPQLPNFGAPQQQQQHPQQQQQAGQQNAQQAQAPTKAPHTDSRDWMHPVARQHMDSQQSMIDATNSAWQNEMDSRVAQEREGRQQEHEKWLASMSAQQNSGPSMQQAAPDHTEFNNALMQMAGLGGRTITSDNNGMRVSNGPFSHIASALRG